MESFRYVGKDHTVIEAVPSSNAAFSRSKVDGRHIAWWWRPSIQMSAP
jgi:hypothetical protein